MVRIAAAVLLCWFGLLSLSFFAANARHGHGKPTPTPGPSATPSATPVPKVTLAWDASAGASGYHLWLGFSSGLETEMVDVGSAQIWTLALNSGTTYYFVVTAYNSGGDSLPSNEVSYTTP